MATETATARRRYLPSLYYSHPGFFFVASGIAFTHLALAADTVSTSRLHSSKGWTVAVAALHGHMWIATVVHVAIFALIVVGMYRAEQFILARWGLLLSVVTFNSLGAAFLLAAIRYGTSFIGTILLASMSLTSVAGYREPVDNPLTFRA